MLGLVSLVPASGVQAFEHSTSGHVNRVVRFADDGVGSDIQQLDGGAYVTRLRWKAAGDVTPHVRARILIEAGAASNDSFTVGLKETGFPSGFLIRHSALGFSGRWGHLGLGHTSEAFDSVAEADLSGTWIVDEPADDYAAFIAWRRSDGSTVDSPDGDPLLVFDVRSDFDGNRQDVLRYDSPRIGPLQLIGNLSNDNNWSVQGNIVHDFGAVRIDARAGYRQGRQRDGFDSFTVSASLLAGNGFNLTAMYGFRGLDSPEPDPRTLFVKGGYRWGNNAASVGWSTVHDLTAGVDSDRLTFGIVHTLPRADAELYANFQYYFGLDGIADVEDISSFIVGTRVGFE